MSIEAESLVVQVGADTSSADQTLAQFSARVSEQLAGIETKIDGLGSGGGSGGGAGGAIDDFFGKFLTFQAVIQAARAVAGFAETAVNAYAENERLGQSLETLVARELRNADATLSMGDALDQAGPKAAELLKWNEQLAINSPFNEAGIAAAFRTAEGYGFVSDSADKTAITAKRLTQDLVDFAAGSGRTADTVNQVALALGQIEAKGKVAGQEVLQLVNAGIPVDQILAKAFNKTTAEIVALREQGMIPADQAVKAIAYSLENDFGGAAQRQSGTVSGLLNSLSDLETIGSRELFSGAIQAAQPYLQEFVDTLNSPEAQASIKSISESLGTIVTEELPQIISQGRAWYDGVSTVYGVVKPIVDAYEHIASIKIGGLGEVGDAIGANPIMKFATGGYIPDLIGQYERLTHTTAEAQNAQAAANTAYDAAIQQTGDMVQAEAASQAAYTIAMAAHTDRTKDDTQTVAEAAQEQQKLALSTQASAEALKKYQDQLDKTGQTGQAAYEKLADSQTTYQGQEKQRGIDHAASMNRIVTDARDRQQTDIENFNDQETRSLESHNRQIDQANRSFRRQNHDADVAEQERQQSALEQHQGRVLDIQTRGLERQAAQQVSDAAREQNYQTQRTDLAAQSAAQISTIKSNEHDRQASAEQSYQDRITALVQRGADLQTQAAAQLADRQQQYAQRIQDLQANAADTAQTNDEQFQEDKQTRASDHNDRLSDLAQQLHDATDAKQRQAIQKQIDSEDERYAKQEAKAETSYERQEQKAEKALQRQLEQAAQAEARQEQQAADSLAKQQVQLAQEQATQDKAYAESEAKAKTAYDRQLATQDEATAKQLAKLQDTHAKQVASDETRYQADMASLQKSYNAEVDGYNKSEATHAQHLTTERQQRQAALAQQLSDAQTAFDSGEQKAIQAFDKQQHAADLARQKQLASENSSFARAEQNAQVAFDKQQASLDAALGKQLLAYTDTQLKMSAITAQEADKRHAVIAKEFGVDPAAAQGQFAAYLAQLSGPQSTGGAANAGAVAAGLQIHGGVTIVLQAVNDPVANASAMQAALLQLQQRNGGTGITP